jgi:hypothetical protein
MWEANNTGSCKSTLHGGGCLSLLSTGKSANPSFFGDASASGDDAFLVTSERLVGQDQDQLFDVYDARIGGGLLSQSQPPPLICTGIEACLGSPPAPSVIESPGSAAFSGPGNVKAKPGCPKGKRKARVKGKVRCVPKKGKKRRNRTARKTRRASR